MKELILKMLKQFASVFTDKDWDADAVKIFGVALILAGLWGWWNAKSDFQWVVGFGCSMVVSGKISTQG